MDGGGQEFADRLQHLSSLQGHAIYVDYVVQERRG